MNRHKFHDVACQGNLKFCQGIVREMSGNFYSTGVWQPCLTRDLAGKFGDQAVSQVILKSSSNSADSQNPPLGDSSLGTLSTG